MSIKIYDLFGCELTETTLEKKVIVENYNNNEKKTTKNNFNYDYIILDITSPEYIDLILTSINQYNGSYIYKYECSDEFKNYCNKLGLNIDNYIKLGDYIIYDINDIKIILANKNNIFITDRYTLIDTIGQLSIWKPHTINTTYTNFGVVCTCQTNEIPSEPIGLISSAYVKIFNSNFNDLFQNDYCVLGNKINGKRKLLTLNMINNNKINENIEIDDKPIENNKIIKNKWNKYKNNDIFLTISDILWYKNLKQIISPNNINNKNFIKKNKKKYINKDFTKTNTIIYNKYTDKSTYVIIVLFILIILLFLYNKYQKKK